MTALEAFRQAVEECSRFGYDYAKLRAIHDTGVDPPWETPAELQASREGICRDYLAWTAARAFALCPGLDVRAIAGTFLGFPHAWLELHDGDDVWWGDPAPTSGEVQLLAWWLPGRNPEWAFRFDGRAFGDPRACILET